jgi:hypothetical protein
LEKPLIILFDKLFAVGQLHDPRTGILVTSPLNEAGYDYALPGPGGQGNNRIARLLGEIGEEAVDRGLLVIPEYH